MNQYFSWTIGFLAQVKMHAWYSVERELNKRLSLREEDKVTPRFDQYFLEKNWRSAEDLDNFEIVQIIDSASPVLTLPG